MLLARSRDTYTILLIAALCALSYSLASANDKFPRKNKPSLESFSSPSSNTNRTQTTRTKIKKDRDKRVSQFNETNKTVFMNVSERPVDLTWARGRWDNKVRVQKENGFLFENKNGVYVLNNKSDTSDKVVKIVSTGTERNKRAIVRRQHKEADLQNPSAPGVGRGDTSADSEGFSLDKFSPSPMMLIPQLIMLGFSPVILANLKVMVMNALMLNNMALSSALLMTFRNMFFGPTGGAKVKYPNYGYQNHRVSQRRRFYDGS